MSRRLYLVWTNPLFRDSARTLLNHPEVVLLGATSDYGVASHDILHYQPDTIVVEEVEDCLPGELVELLRRNRINVRLISASLNRNWLQIWECEQRRLVQADDLIALVLDPARARGDQ